jgi:flagellar biosynthesis protein FlhG
MFNVKIKKNILHVLKGEATVNEVVIPVTKNLYLIPGASGEEILKYNDEHMFQRFLEEADILDDLDILLLDTGAGIGEHIQVFLRAADDVLVVTVPDPAAITDAYATIKIAHRIQPRIGMILNQVRSQKEAEVVFSKIKTIAEKNVGDDLTLELIGKLDDNKEIAKCVKQRQLFVQAHPLSASAKDLEKIVKRIAKKMERNVLVNEDESGLRGLFKRLVEQF